jgi:hypothetical protein
MSFQTIQTYYTVRLEEANVSYKPLGSGASNRLVLVLLVVL